MRMLRRSTFALAVLSSLGFSFGSVNSASATWWGHGSHGSSGGSHGSSGGSYGSSGGSYGSSGGSYGSSGGGYESAWGSSGGSYGSSGGSWGSSGGWYGSAGGSWGSSGGSYGSDGGSYGSAGGSYGSAGGGYYAASNTSNSVATTQTRVAYLNVKVPAEAKVYLQGQPMTLTGAERRYVTPELQAGKQHLYTVRVDVQRDGRTLSKTTSAAVRPGQEVEISVSFDERNPKELVASVSPASNR